MTARYSAAELAAMRLPGLPRSFRHIRQRAARERWPYELRACEGAPAERVYPLEVLPAAARRMVARRMAAEDVAAEGTAMSDKTIAEERIRLVEAADALVAGGMPANQALEQAAAGTAHSSRSLRRWRGQVKGVPREEWADALVPRRQPPRMADCHPEAWEYIKADYLRASRPAWSACYSRLLEVAAEKRWAPIPSARTLFRRFDATVSLTTRALKREGPKALVSLYPTQERDRSSFHAVECVNADGQRVDVRVLWPDGSVERPILLGAQDLFSDKMLAYRVDKTESAELIRLTFADLCSTWGVPEHIYFDNGRAFGAKDITGGCGHRFRWPEAVADEAQGILVQLGIAVHWTLPYSGKSKPIERAWRDFCEHIAKHPTCDGAYCGNSPTNKPHNYGERAVPLAEFMSLLDSEIAAHNAREGRRTRVCRGRSFDQVFEESYRTSVIRTLTEDQRRILLLSSTVTTVSARDGVVRLLGNRFYDELLAAHLGETVVLRYDAGDVTKGVYVYTPRGQYLCHAPMLELTGFADTAAAREHARARGHFVKAAKKLAELEVTLDPSEVARLHLGARGIGRAPRVPKAPPKVVRGLFGRPLPEPPVSVEPTASERERRSEQDDLITEVGRAPLANLPRRREPFAAGE